MVDREHPGVIWPWERPDRPKLPPYCTYLLISDSFQKASEYAAERDWKLSWWYWIESYTQSGVYEYKLVDE